MIVKSVKHKDELCPMRDKNIDIQASSLCCRQFCRIWFVFSICMSNHVKLLVNQHIYKILNNLAMYSKWRTNVYKCVQNMQIESLFKIYLKFNDTRVQIQPLNKNKCVNVLKTCKLNPMCLSLFMFTMCLLLRCCLLVKRVWFRIVVICWVMCLCWIMCWTSRRGDMITS